MDIFQRVPKLQTQAQTQGVAGARGPVVETRKRQRPLDSDGHGHSDDHGEEYVSVQSPSRRPSRSQGSMIRQGGPVQAQGKRGPGAKQTDPADMSLEVPEAMTYDPSAELPAPTPTLLLSLEDKMVLNNHALSMLQAGRPGVPLIMVAMVGKARRGKSFLLNRAMLGQSKHMFQVSSSSNACTKGIMIHGKPWPLRALARRSGMSEEDIASFADVDVVFADTEGIDATDRTDGYDNNMLTFACVASGAIIYNAHGPIDEDALSKISTIAEVGRSILDENQGDRTGESTLHPSVLPSFHWCARDFALDCHDGQGNEITPDEYLEYQLAEQADQHPKKSAMRRALRNFFSVRMCHTLPRPVASEDDLKRVQDMRDDDLRPQFMDAMKLFRKRLFSTLHGKQVGTSMLTATDTVAMMLRFVQAINQGAVPNVQDSWQQVAVSRAKRACDSASQWFKQQVDGGDANGRTCELYGTVRDAWRQARVMYASKIQGLLPQVVAEYDKVLEQNIFDIVKARLDTCLAQSEIQHRENVRRAAALHVAHVQGGASLFDEPQAVEQRLAALVDALMSSAQGTPSNVSESLTSVDDELQRILNASLMSERALAILKELPGLLSSQHALSAGSGSGCVAEFESMKERYEQELKTLNDRVGELEHDIATAQAVKCEAERVCSELSEKLQASERSCDALREQLEFANAGESRAVELEREVREMREAEMSRSEEAHRRMDEFEQATRAHLEEVMHDLASHRERLHETEHSLSQTKQEAAELEKHLLMERKAAEARDKAVESERAIIREELQSTRAMLSEAHSKLMARSEGKYTSALQAAEERLKFSQQLRAVETAATKAQAEKASLEREVNELREKLKQFGSLRSDLDDCKLAASKTQAENEWLKNERRSLQEQLRANAKELMLVRQDLREVRMTSAISASRTGKTQ